MTQLRNTIRMLVQLDQGDKTTNELVDHFGASTPTIKRMIAEGRRLGADVAAIKHPEHGYRYHLKNGKEIHKVLYNWLGIFTSVTNVENRATQADVLKNPNALQK